MSLKKYKTIGLICAIAGVLLLSYVIWQGNSEPRVDGIRLSEWFRQYVTRYRWDGKQAHRSRAEVVQAFGKFGPEGIEYLVNIRFQCGPENLSIFHKSFERIRKHPYITKWVGMPRRKPFSNPEKSNGAQELLTALNPPAPLILSKVAEPLRSPKEADRRIALSLMECIGQERAPMIPYLEEILVDTTETEALRLKALHILGSVGNSRDWTVPYLHEILENSSETEALRLKALLLLGSIENARDNTEPYLNEILTDSSIRFNSTTFRNEAALILFSMDPDQPVAFDHLMNVVKSGNDFRFIHKFLAILPDIGGTENQLESLRMSALKNLKQPAPHVVYQVLNQSHYTTNQIISIIQNMMPNLMYTGGSGASTNDFWIGAAERIDQVPMNHPLVVSSLIQKSKNSSGIGIHLIDLLGRSGPGAIEAMPYLNRALRHPKVIYWKPAFDAMEKMGVDLSDKTPLLMKKMENPDTRNKGNRLAAAERIIRWQPSHPIVIEMLTELLRSKAGANDHHTIEILAIAGPHAKQAIQVIRSFLNHKNPKMREVAENAIKAISPQSQNL
jgi:HEAT repeat protein